MSRKSVIKDELDATVRDAARIKRELDAQTARVAQIAYEAAAQAASERTAAAAKRVFRETLGHKIRRWLKAI